MKRTTPNFQGPGEGTTTPHPNPLPHGEREFVSGLAPKGRGEDLSSARQRRDKGASNVPFYQTNPPVTCFRSCSLTIRVVLRKTKPGHSIAARTSSMGRVANVVA